MKKHIQVKTKAKHYIKYSLTSFDSSKTDIVEIIPLFFNNFVFLDIASCTQIFFFLNFLPINKDLTLYLKIKSLNTIYNSIAFQKNATFVNYSLYNYIQVLVHKKVILKGFFLNKTKFFIIVGFFGFCGLIPKTHFLIHSKVYTKNKVIFFNISNFDFQKKQFIGSQKDLIKKTNRILLKLASRLVFVFKNNK